ncbi:MAG TPA: type III-B CRISPR module-associated protein Cmr5 [Saprospiraceae bacterium]|mgnify:CR=1 FL=1|nr:type III-B CRISPR module-associated protein Cmr5 [Saprospiraceae bacterium]
MNKINQLLPTAMSALKDSGLLFNEKTCILKEYDGYVASFAPSVITAGLKATLSFYTDRHKIKDAKDYKPDFTNKATEPRRVHILNILLKIYQEKYGRLAGGDLLTIALDTNANDERQLRKDLMDCAIALKLVMRNFKQEEKAPKPVKKDFPTAQNQTS